MVETIFMEKQVVFFMLNKLSLWISNVYLLNMLKY